MSKHVERPRRRPVNWQMVNFFAHLLRILLDLSRNA
jgi:hypothetical protein